MSGAHGVRLPKTRRCGCVGLVLTEKVELALANEKTDGTPAITEVILRPGSAAKTGDGL
jgi:hypothetical protein